jgi:hypothetical protein
MRIYFSLVGVLCLTLSIWLFARRIRVLQKGVSTIGRIIRFEARETDGSVSYHPCISFQDQKGSEHTFTSNSGTYAPQIEIGTEVLVRYLPDDPTLAFIPTFLYMWAAPLTFLILGLGGLSAGFVPD